MSIDFNLFGSIEDDPKHSQNMQGHTLEPALQPLMNNLGEHRDDKYLDITANGFFDAQKNMDTSLFLTRAAIKPGVMFEGNWDQVASFCLARWQFGPSDWASMNALSRIPIDPTHTTYVADFGAHLYRHYITVQGYVEHVVSEYIIGEVITERMLVDRLGDTYWHTAEMGLPFTHDQGTWQTSNTTLDLSQLIVPDWSVEQPNLSAYEIAVEDETDYQVGAVVYVTNNDNTNHYLVGQIIGVNPNTLLINLINVFGDSTSSDWTVIQSLGLEVLETDVITINTDNGLFNHREGLFDCIGWFNDKEPLAYSGGEILHYPDSDGYGSVEFGYSNVLFNRAVQLGVGNFQSITYYENAPQGVGLNRFEALDYLINRKHFAEYNPRELFDDAMTEEWQSDPHEYELLDRTINEVWP